MSPVGAIMGLPAEEQSRSTALARGRSLRRVENRAPVPGPELAPLGAFACTKLIFGASRLSTAAHAPVAVTSSDATRSDRGEFVQDRTAIQRRGDLYLALGIS